MTVISAAPVHPIVWEARLGRLVALIEERLFFDAREKARAMLGGEPEYVEVHTPPTFTPESSFGGVLRNFAASGYTASAPR